MKGKCINCKYCESECSYEYGDFGPTGRMEHNYTCDNKKSDKYEDWIDPYTTSCRYFRKERNFKNLLHFVKRLFFKEKKLTLDEILEGVKNNERKK